MSATEGSGSCGKTLRSSDERQRISNRLAELHREFDYHDGYQTCAKVLINSAYGFLGGPFFFNDHAAAAAVTTGGRDVVTKAADELQARDCSIIELDTDGVMFIPPACCQTPEDEASLVAAVSNTLPHGINLAHDGRYAKMLSLAMKNYVLLDYEGKKTIKGASLKNRSAEPLLAGWLEEALTLLFDGSLDAVVDLYYQFARKIHHRAVEPDKLSRRERITDKTFSSLQKKRLGLACKGLTVGDYAWVYEREDGSIALIEDYQEDENRLYYIEKLWKTASRFAGLFPDFKDRFTKPGKRNFDTFATR